MGRKVKSQMNVMTVTKVGQVTIPKFLREKYNIVDTVRMVERPEGLLIKKEEALDERLDRVRAKFSKKTKTWIKENSGKTAGELREDALKSREWARYVEEKYGV